MRIAIVAVTLSLAAMIVSVSVGRGFQLAVRERVVGFVGDFEIVRLDNNASFEQNPIPTLSVPEEAVRLISGVVTVQRYAIKPGIIKTDEDMHGCVLRGVDSSSDLSFFVKFLKRGRIPNFATPGASQEVLVSELQARALGLDTGQRMTIYFVQDPPRVRRFEIVGIYDTQFVEFDEKFVLTDLRHIQRLNGWGGDQAGGYQVHVRPGADLESIFAQLQDLCAFKLLPDGSALRVVDVRDKHSALFDWLGLLDLNVVVLLVLMLVVAAVNMITALLILILEQTRTIGLLKALGAWNQQIRRIFLVRAARILLWGLGLGNVVGLALCQSQIAWHWARLDPAEYYVDHVPVLLSGAQIILLNLATLALILALLLIPSTLIARVRPAESLSKE